MKVIVIGAGVVGLAIAVELAQRGADVTVVEKNTPGSGTSSTSYAWVNANNKEPISYFELNRAGLQGHKKIAAEGAWLQQTGHVEFATDEAHRAELEARVGRVRGYGYEVETVSPERAQELIPELIVPENWKSGVFFPQEAHCYPSLYLGHLLDQAAGLGVTVLTGVAVTGFDTPDQVAAPERAAAPGKQARVTLSDGTTLSADRVVSAAGRWTNQIADLADVPLPMVEFQQPGDVTVGYLAITNPLPVSMNRLMTSPWLNVRPAGGGRLLLQALDVDVTADPTHVPDVDSDVAEELLSRLRAVLKNTEGARVAELQVGQRAMPRDGLSVIGTPTPAPWLYIVATHSGVTLAPILGTGVASEIFGEDEPLFAEFRPDRFGGDVQPEAPRPPRRPGEQ